MTEIPIIKMTLEGMRLSILQAFNDYAAKRDADVRQAVAEFCESGNIEKIIAEAVQVHVARAIDEEVRNYFNYGEGRKTIAALVTQRMATPAAKGGE